MSNYSPGLLYNNQLCSSKIR